MDCVAISCLQLIFSYNDIAAHNACYRTNKAVWQKMYRLFQIAWQKCIRLHWEEHQQIVKSSLARRIITKLHFSDNLVTPLFLQDLLEFPFLRAIHLEVHAKRSNDPQFSYTYNLSQWTQLLNQCTEIGISAMRSDNAAYLLTPLLNQMPKLRSLSLTRCKWPKNLLSVDKLEEISMVQSKNLPELLPNLVSFVPYSETLIIAPKLMSLDVSTAGDIPLSQIFQFYPNLVNLSISSIVDDGSKFTLNHFKQLKTFRWNHVSGSFDQRRSILFEIKPISTGIYSIHCLPFQQYCRERLVIRPIASELVLQTKYQPWDVYQQWRIDDLHKPTSIRNVATDISFGNLPNLFQFQRHLNKYVIVYDDDKVCKLNFPQMENATGGVVLVAKPERLLAHAVDECDQRPMLSDVAKNLFQDIPSLQLCELGWSKHGRTYKFYRDEFVQTNSSAN